MGLIPGRCTQCGGLLEIDAAQNMFVCPYCHTPFIVEKVVNYYNVTRNVDDWVRSADALAEVKEYSEAEREFGRITREHAYDYRGWWGLVKAKSKLFADYDISKRELDEIETLYEKASHFATDADKSKIQYIYSEYVSSVRRKLQNLKADTSMKLEHLVVEYERNKTLLENQIKNLIEQENSNSKVARKIKWIILVIAVIINYNIFSDNETIYPIQIVVYSAVGYGIGKILEILYVKKANELKNEANTLRLQLDNVTRAYNSKRIPLEQLMQKCK